MSRAGTITDSQAQALASFVALIHTDWHIPGIRTAIHTAKRRAPADELAIALIRLAGRDDLRTPAVLAQDGPHWHGLETAAARAPQRPKCPAHGLALRVTDGLCVSCLAETKGADDNRADTLTVRPEQIDTTLRGVRLARRELDAALHRTPIDPGPTDGPIDTTTEKEQEQ